VVCLEGRGEEGGRRTMRRLFSLSKKRPHSPQRLCFAISCVNSACAEIKNISHALHQLCASSLWVVRSASDG
jgi:hypothetical protein